MVTAPPIKNLITADELLSLPTGNGLRYELIQGELHTMSPAGGEHGRIGARLLGLMVNYVIEHQLGEVLGAETGFKIERNPDTVRAPDMAFLRTERWADQARPEAFIEGPPDLAVEIVSPGDTSYEVHEKALAWLEAGSRLVWIVHPHSRTVTVYWPDRRSQVFSSSETIDGGDVIPGFTMDVRRVFE